MHTLIQESEPASVQLAELRHLCATGAARAIRQGANLMLTDLARDVAVSKSTIARWESGDVRPTGTAALSYLRILRRLEQRSRQFGAALTRATR